MGFARDKSFWRYFMVSALLASGFVLAPQTSQAQETSIPITFHKQEYSLSCEVATLKMALRVHGIEVTEQELISKLPFDPTPKQPGIWGNPHEGFVGRINGRMLVTGYGVYWDPIAALGAKYASTQVLRHSSATELAQHITQGNPVIIWGYYGQRAVYSWRTPTGEAIKAVNGEHTMVVYGFDGPAHAPTRFYLMDPAQGPITWSAAELMHNWSSLEHMGVVVAPHKQWVRVSTGPTVWEINTKQNTRQPITSWAAFMRRGGSAAAIRSIDSAKLLTYKVGSPLN